MSPLFLPVFLLAAFSAQSAPAAAPSGVAPAAQPQVLFSRSGDTAGQPPQQKTASVAVTDSMRRAPVFTRIALEVHLEPSASRMEVLAHLLLRNSGSEPLPAVPLQLSSSLHMERVLLGGKPLALAQQRLASDADHTGMLEETAVVLPEPLAPGASVALTAEYSGTIERSTARLDRIGTPPEIAERSDWDEISDTFTGLRGFGDVVWYPVCSVPALLGAGAELFSEIARQRAANQGAVVTLRVTEEYTGDAPTIAVLAGRPLQVGAPRAVPSAGFPGVVEVSLAPTPLGFRALSLVLAPRTEAAEDPANILEVWATPEHVADAQGWVTATSLLQPLLRAWLPGKAPSPLTVVELPQDGATPSEQGTAVLLSLRAAAAPELAPMLSSLLPRALFRSPRPWLQEGVPAFLSTLWTERSTGRDAALERVAGSLPALELAEPNGGGGKSLLESPEAIQLRTKGVYVLWMLRDLAGDAALQQALKQYDAEADTRPDYFESLVERASGKDLRWFFDAWVYHDLGLADLSIGDVFASHDGDRWIVTVTVTNEGSAEVEVPVSIVSAAATATERWRVAGHGRVTRRVVVASEPTAVEVNDGTVPEETTSVHRRLLASAPAS